MGAIDPWRISPRPKKSWEDLPHLVTISNDDVMTFHAVEMDDEGKAGVVHGIVTPTIFDAQAHVLVAENYHPGRISSHIGGSPGVDLRVRFTEGPYENMVRPIQITLSFNSVAPEPGESIKIQEAQRNISSGEMSGYMDTTSDGIMEEITRRMNEYSRQP